MNVKLLFPIAATIATTLLSWSAPAQALSLYNFSWTGNDDYSVSGSFSYDDSLYSGIIGKNQLDYFNISFLKDGEVKQTYSTLPSLFYFEFDTGSRSVKSMDAGAFSSYYFLNADSDSVPLGSLSFVKFPSTQTDTSGCDGLVWVKDSPTTTHSSGRCDSNSSVVVVPAQAVPEPASIMGLLALGAFGTVSRLKRRKELT